MLIIFITSTLIAICLYIVFSFSNGENKNNRKQDNLSLFDSESKVISGLEGLEEITKNKLKDEREILFLQDVQEELNVEQRENFKERRKVFSLALGIAGMFMTLCIYFYPVELGSYSLLKDTEIFESFLNGSKDERVERKELFKNTYSDYIVKNQEKSNNIYALAISLKNLEEFDLSRMAYQSLFINHKDDLSGDIFAEYTQVLYFSEGRRFTEQTKELLDLTLLKAPDNPVALTLKGLQYLGEKNLDQTIIQWSKAASFITNEREKEELKIAIKALNNRKNQ
jgi:hypothetical protein|tara:strand:- start:215 stop:1063 length:849 start_codon:yes stop_codon:yes gene_type:complete